MCRRQKRESPYESYKKALTGNERAELSAFFSEFDIHCTLPANEKNAMRKDFQKAFLYYSESGISVSEATSRLSIKNLGGFYSRPPILWFPLDDAAKVYPLSMKYGQMAVFRLSIYLKMPVIPELLQIALTFVIKRFPGFATTVKKGFFWHYLDTAKKRFSVEPENGLPCRPIKISGSGSQPFRVIYYKNRISVEFFHIMTDGTGGMTFLKTLTAEYLKLTGVEYLPSEGVLGINDTPTANETSNEFSRADKSGGNSGFLDKPAVQMSGKLTKGKPYQILYFKINATELKAVAKKYNATITAYVLAQLFIAGKYATDDQNGEISIQVPVNMRKFYPSQTMRNFSMYCGIRLSISDITTAAGIIPEIARQLEEKASLKAMSEMMNSTQNMVKSVRYVPLFIKAPIAGLAYGFLGDKIFSNTLSNLGVVKMPDELAGYIDSMDFVLGTALTNRAGCAIVTYGQTSTLSISKTTNDPSFEEKLYELLSLDGMEIRVEGSEPYAD